MSKSNTKKSAAVTETVEIVVPETSTPTSDTRKNVIEMSMVEWDDICKTKGLKTKSAMIRYLWAENYTRSAIAKFLGIIYQHVRNVLVQEPKKPSTLANTSNKGETS